ncbi:MAG: glycosyltransferase [Alphaproteobacteria bacterium]|nr:glycosyltransferase [Alphaproteobacteria bacterium]MBV9372941.1 glycosyltransferase [Alphaproteobacteria bacterium]MBV9900940.1 glycosyltransferase [Alphaproteobacteria bacterium]
MRILAAIVTYNRRALLERCIDHVRGQTRPPDGLIVINNSSPDDTVEMLEAKGVRYVTQPNVGSAGGWKRSIEEALAGGWDAVWLMDDDGYPHPGALALLEARLTGDVPCVSSVVLCEDNPNRFVFPFPVLDRRGLPVMVARRRKIRHLDRLRQVAGGDTYPFAHLFNGALVSTEAARRIGNVESDFFLMGDEVDFFMRLRRLGPVLSHLDAHHLHPDVSGRPLDPAKFYYYVKNTIILNRRYFDKVWARHAMAVVAALARTAHRNSIPQALSYVAGPRAPVLWKAVSRGLSGRVGKDFDG